MRVELQQKRKKKVEEKKAAPDQTPQFDSSIVLTEVVEFSFWDIRFESRGHGYTSAIPSRSG